MERLTGEGLPDPGGIVLAGPFDPATVARFAPQDVRERIEGIHSAPGVPIHMLAATMVKRGIPLGLIGGVRNVPPLEVRSSPLSVSIYTKGGGWPFLLNGLAQERKNILEILGRWNPRIVHAHWTLEAGRAVGDWSGPKLLTVHDTAWDYARLGFSLNPLSLAYTARWLANTSQTLHRFKHLVAVSPYVETYLRTRHQFRGEIRVIPNGVQPFPADIQISSQFPKSGAVTFACYGGFGGLKNAIGAVKAFQIVEPQLPGSRLLVFGDGWQRAGDEYRTRGIDFRGSTPHSEFLRTLGEEVDIWIHPSRVETHGLVLCEALQANCAVVAGKNSGAVAWTLGDGEAGLLVDIEDPEAIAAAMLELVRDRRGAEALVAKGQELIHRRFDPDRALDLHLKYYDDVASVT